MKCNEISELMPNLAAGLEAGTAEVNKHLESCAGLRRQAERIPPDHGVAG